MNKIKHIHFVGIKGVGMAPLAIIAKEAGFRVTGSDVADKFITDTLLAKKEIEPFVGFSQDHITGADMVITTGAHGGYNNIEVKKAKELKLPILTQGQAVGEFMKGKIFGRSLQGIAIAGCHGKTTTTAMVATILRSAGLDPSFIIGTGDITSLESSGHYGKGKFFVAEADEYATEPNYDKTPKFLWQHPHILVITNIEFDHPDLYKNIDEVRNAYQKLTGNLAEDGGILIANGDDVQVQKLLENYNGKKITFGFNSDNEYTLSRVIIENGLTKFSVYHENSFVGDFTTHAIGKHNGLNGLSAIIVSIITNVEISEIQKGLLLFKGTKRRFEYKGKLASGAKLYDDYAHHPTEIKKTLEAFKSLYPDKKIVCIFQPHTYSRTKLLFDEFSSSFTSADIVILSSIYASAREVIDPSVSITHLAEKINAYGNEVLYLETPSDVIKYIKSKQFGNDFVVVTMGAGDIYKIDSEILQTE